MSSSRLLFASGALEPRSNYRSTAGSLSVALYATPPRDTTSPFLLVFAHLAPADKADYNTKKRLCCGDFLRAKPLQIPCPGPPGAVVLFPPAGLGGFKALQRGCVRLRVAFGLWPRGACGLFGSAFRPLGCCTEAGPLPDGCAGPTKPSRYHQLSTKRC